VANITYTDEEIENSVDEQVWTYPYTDMLANFEDSLEAGNLTGGDLPVTGWKIKRKAEDEDLYTDLGEIPHTGDASAQNFIDYIPRNKVLYTYEIYAMSGDTIGLGYGGTGMSDSFYWSLVSYYVTPATPTQSYYFDLNIDTGKIQNETDVKVYNTYTQYPAIRTGLRDYLTGNISTMPYNVIAFDENGNDVEVTTGLLNEIRAFLNDSSLKILRYPSGLTLTVATKFDEFGYMDKSSLQPYDIKFTWWEVGEV
jgi:hypothetical protein